MGVEKALCRFERAGWLLVSCMMWSEVTPHLLTVVVMSDLPHPDQMTGCDILFGEQKMCVSSLESHI